MVVAHINYGARCKQCRNPKANLGGSSLVFSDTPFLAGLQGGQKEGHTKYPNDHSASVHTPAPTFAQLKRGSFVETRAHHGRKEQTTNISTSYTNINLHTYIHTRRSTSRVSVSAAGAPPSCCAAQIAAHAPSPPPALRAALLEPFSWLTLKGERHVMRPGATRRAQDDPFHLGSKGTPRKTGREHLPSFGAIVSLKDLKNKGLLSRNHGCNWGSAKGAPQTNRAACLFPLNRSEKNGTTHQHTHTHTLPRGPTNKPKDPRSVRCCRKFSANQLSQRDPLSLLQICRRPWGGQCEPLTVDISQIA